MAPTTVIIANDAAPPPEPIEEEAELPMTLGPAEPCATFLGRPVYPTLHALEQAIDRYPIAPPSLPAARAWLDRTFAAAERGRPCFAALERTNWTPEWGTSWVFALLAPVYDPRAVRVVLQQSHWRDAVRGWRLVTVLMPYKGTRLPVVASSGDVEGVAG